MQTTLQKLVFLGKKTVTSTATDPKKQINICVGMQMFVSRFGGKFNGL
jgi:imidazoleglycerol phosphate synthase glutamine amidotransferase subunit HisH